MTTPHPPAPTPAPILTVERIARLDKMWDWWQYSELDANRATAQRELAAAYGALRLALTAAEARIRDLDFDCLTLRDNCQTASTVAEGALADADVWARVLREPPNPCCPTCGFESAQFSTKPHGFCCTAGLTNMLFGSVPQEMLGCRYEGLAVQAQAAANARRCAERGHPLPEIPATSEEEAKDA